MFNPNGGIFFKVSEEVLGIRSATSVSAHFPEIRDAKLDVSFLKSLHA
jgi:hypothetical protein